MTRSRLRLKALGLSAVVLGLMAFGAGAARAANWMVGANNVTSTLSPEIQIKEIEELIALPKGEKHLVLLTKIGGTKVNILCTGASLVGVQLETGGKLTEGGKAKITGCETFLNGTLSAVCVPKSFGQANGTVASEEVKGQLGLFGFKKLIQIQPKTGENFAVLRFGGECPLPESVPIKGTLFIKDCFNIETSSLDHLIEVDNAESHIFAISDTAEHKVELHGSVLVMIWDLVDYDAAWSGLAE
jgi:hypothetical protein